MWTRFWLTLAAATWIAVVGCGLLASKEAPQPTDAADRPRAFSGREGLPYRAVGMQIQRVDWIEKYKQSVDEIASLGADTVKFVVDARQENGRSARIYLDLRMTPTPEALSELIRHAKSKGLRVILMPIVLLDRPVGNEWRGTISPLEDNGGWEAWFESYREMLTHFAWIAEGAGVDVFSVGSELVSAQKHPAQWKRTIREIRKVFSGRLTYSCNWDNYHAVPFWDDLDLIGMNSYWSFGTESAPQPSVEQINKRWAEIQQDLLPFVRKVGKPLIFLEIGWFSQSNVAYEPWDYTRDQPSDPELQKRLYEGFFQSWHGKPELGGFSVWEWTPGDGGPEDKGYTPENKPAEAVLRTWLARKWDVSSG
jgi:hypothetical protein